MNLEIPISWQSENSSSEPHPFAWKNGGISSFLILKQLNEA
jgi:hypothetical protein